MGRQGLVTRATDPTDARARLIVLTPLGRNAKKTLVPVVKKLVAAMEDSISDRDLETTRKTLQRLVENMS
jgi:DNA-binding MarR family transcriptional regulator